MKTIDARPFAYPLPADNPPVLIVIDMQRDFIEPGGFGSALGNDVELLRKIVPTVKRLIDSFRELDLPIVHTREAHLPDLSDCPESKRLRGDCKLRIGDDGPMGRVLIDGEPGNAIIDELKPWHNEYELAKPGKGAFYHTPLKDILEVFGATHLVFAGVTTEVCVQTSMREANDRGYQCLLVEDATESYFPEFKRAAIDMMTAQGAIVGWAADCNSVITALRSIYGK